MLYIFGHAPPEGTPLRLNAGGLQRAIERVEEIALLEHSPFVQYTKENAVYRISDALLAEGITWDWFPEKWSFGNGVTCHKTSATFETKIVVHDTESSLGEFLVLGQSIKLADLRLTKVHHRTEGWEKYEARWLPGTCPQENHLVHLAWLVTRQPLPPLAYDRIRELIEDNVEVDRAEYDEEQHFSVIRPWHAQKGERDEVAPLF